MAAISNVDLNNVGVYGNTGTVKAFLEPALVRAVVLVPKGTIIPKAQMVDTTTFNTYVAGKFMDATTGSRWRAFTNLDDFKDNTKKPSSEDTGLLQTQILKYAPVHSFRYMSNMGNFIEALSFHNCQAWYDYFYIDANGTWQGCVDPTGAGGLSARSLHQFFVQDMGLTTDKTANQYMIDVHSADRKQLNENFRYYAAGTDISSIVMPANAVLTDVTDILGTPLSVVTTTDIVLTIKSGVDSYDVVKAYTTALTAACFSAYNLTTGASMTAPTRQGVGTIVVAGQSYSYVWLRFGTAPTSGHVVQISLVSPTALNAIIPNANLVSEAVQPGVNGANCAVHTF